ncbi:WxL protein peptidoglycan domain-containing protein [Xylanimonas allomyrinae]|nr:DUF916 domain-containing protein [Xylanimonas allomyrinae]
MHGPQTASRALLALAALGVVAVALLGTATAATAVPTSATHTEDADTLRWGVSPAPAGSGTARSAFDLVLEPGQSVTDTVSISNLSAHDVTLDVYAADAAITAGGDFTVAARDEPRRDVGAWIGFDAPVVTVPAGKRVDLPFRVTVPPDVTPGDHGGGIVTSVHAGDAATDASSVRLDLRVGARVVVSVPGPVTAGLALTDVTTTYRPAAAGFGLGRLTVAYRLTNTGNLAQSATTTVDAAGLGGLWHSRAHTADVPALLPGQSVRLTETFDDAPPVVRASAHLDVRPQASDGYVPSDPLTGEASSWAAPWVGAGVIALVAAAAWRPARSIARRLRRTPAGDPTPEE